MNEKGQVKTCPFFMHLVGRNDVDDVSSVMCLPG